MARGCNVGILRIQQETAHEQKMSKNSVLWLGIQCDNVRQLWVPNGERTRDQDNSSQDWYGIQEIKMNISGSCRCCAELRGNIHMAKYGVQTNICILDRMQTGYSEVKLALYSWLYYLFSSRYNSLRVCSVSSPAALTKQFLLMLNVVKNFNPIILSICCRKLSFNIRYDNRGNWIRAPNSLTPFDDRSTFRRSGRGGTPCKACSIKRSIHIGHPTVYLIKRQDATNLHRTHNLESFCFENLRSSFPTEVGSC